MRIAIAGGKGTLGRHLTAELSSRGHEVRLLSRSAPEYRVDLATGEGLEPALRGCDVVVDASNNAGRKAAAVLVDGIRRLLAVEQAAGVSHHVFGMSFTEVAAVVGRSPAAVRQLASRARQHVDGGRARCGRGGALAAGFMRHPPTLVRLASVNGRPGLVVRDAGGVLTVVSFTIDRGRISALDVVRNPDKLAAVRGLADQSVSRRARDG
jgi:hypothetical protein